jgi:hypothetical protein
MSRVRQKPSLHHQLIEVFKADGLYFSIVHKALAHGATLTGSPYSLAAPQGAPPGEIVVVRPSRSALVARWLLVFKGMRRLSCSRAQAMLEKARCLLERRLGGLPAVVLLVEKCFWGGEPAACPLAVRQGRDGSH